MTYHNQTCVTPRANSYHLATARSSAFPTAKEKEKTERHMAQYRKKRQKEIQEEILAVKKRISPFTNYKIKGKTIVTIH